MLERSPERSEARTEKKFPLATRWAHVFLASAIIIQLLTSLVMEGPHRGRPGDVIFTVHEVSGIGALFFAFAFWCAVVARRRATPVALLFPWFSANRIRDVIRDGMDQLAQIVRLQLPNYEEESPLASAVHGLGLVLMSVMAITGTIWFVNETWVHSTATLLRIDMWMHHLLANLVWAYLIGHALLALVHHVAGQSSLATMWSLKPSRK